MSQKPKGGSRYTAKAPAIEAARIVAEPETGEPSPTAMVRTETEPAETLPVAPSPVDA